MSQYKQCKNPTHFDGHCDENSWIHNWANANNSLEELKAVLKQEIVEFYKKVENFTSKIKIWLTK